MSLPLKELIKLGEKQLADAGVADSRIDARELYCYMVKTDQSGLMLRWQELVRDNQCEAYFDLIGRRASRVPLQHITGIQEFMGFPFKVDEHVLIPRQDTETMVEDALELLSKGSLRGTEYAKEKSFKGADVLDLCCGSGAIGISLAKLNTQLKVTCSDISTEALRITKENANSLKCEGIHFVESDMLDGKYFNGKLGKKKFDLIISNPPYIESQVIEGLEPEVREHEPLSALDGGADGLDFYRIIAEKAPEHMKKRGVLMMEIGYNQGKAIMDILEETQKFTDIICLADLTGKDRIVVATLADKKGKKG